MSKIKKKLGEAGEIIFVGAAVGTSLALGAGMFGVVSYTILNLFGVIK